MKKFLIISLALVCCSVCSAAPSLTISIPNTFVANQIIYSSQVNSNFTHIQTQYNSHSHTVSSSDITDGTIVNADINASAAIAASKLDATVVETDTTQTISGDKTFSGAVNLPATGVVIGTPSTGVMWYDDGTDMAALSAGTEGQVLKQGATIPEWANAANTALKEGAYVHGPDYSNQTEIVNFTGGNAMVEGLKESSYLGLAVSLTSLAIGDLTTGKVSVQCFDFKGTEADYATIATDASQAGIGAITMEAWVYRDTAGNTNYIIGAQYFALSMTDTKIIGILDVDGAGDEEWDVAHGLSNNGINQWVLIHVAWADGAVAQIYVNGADVGDGNGTGAGDLNDSGGGINIGAKYDNSSPFHGKIDGVRILNRKMGAVEALARYTAFN